jgi:hypothetical protein
MVRAFRAIVALVIFLWVASNASVAHSSPPHGSDGQNSPKCTTWGQWERVNKVDLIDGGTTEKAYLCTHADSNGREGIFDVNATCEMNSIVLDVVYTSLFEKNLRFKPGDVFRNRIAVRANVGGKIRMMSTTFNDYGNEAKFILPEKSPPFKGIPGAYGKEDYPEASRAEIVEAREIRMEFILGNGDTPILTFHPQDEVFQDFVSRPGCTDSKINKDANTFSEKSSERAAPNGFLSVVGIPPADEAMPNRMLYLVPTEYWETLLASGFASHDVKDGIGAMRQACQADEKACFNLRAEFRRLAKTYSPIYKTPQSTMRDVPSGEYHLIFLSSGNAGHEPIDVKGAVVKLAPGANVIQFSEIH